MTDNNKYAQLWEAEYQMGGIPSSLRTTPSGAVEWAVKELRRQNFRLRTAIDVGCGKGRNSLYLAAQGMNVTAMDFTSNAIAELDKEATKKGLTEKIRAIVYDVTEPWPIALNDNDLVVDAFCFKHITGSESRQAYKQNLLRALSVRGHFLISFASIGDGYYGHYIQSSSTDEGTALAIDPANGIESVLFSRNHVVDFFAPELDLCGEMQHNKPSAMHGRIYKRETYALLFRRRPHRFIS